ICHDVLICSAAVVVDGRVIAAIPEERLDRQKQSRGFPTLAIKKCLEQTSLRLEGIEEIAGAWEPSIEPETMPSGLLNAGRWRTRHLSEVPGGLMQVLGAAGGEVPIKGGAVGGPPITYVNHYDSHIGNALYLSPYEKAAVLILDGRAEKQTSLL